MPDKATMGLLTLDVVRTNGTDCCAMQWQVGRGRERRAVQQVSELIPETKRIVLDLTNLARVDSMGLGTLVRLYVSCRSAGCSLELVNLGKQVRQLLGTTHLISVFAIIGEHGIKMG